MENISKMPKYAYFHDRNSLVVGNSIVTDVTILETFTQFYFKFLLKLLAGEHWL